MVGTTGEKKKDDNSEAIITKDTSVELIFGMPCPRLLYLLSTYSGMMVSTLRKSDYETKRDSKQEIRIFVKSAFEISFSGVASLVVLSCN